MDELIRIENLTHRFADGTLGLEGVSATIGEGEFVVLAGANGSGKTTLLRHLNGLLRPTAGSVRVAGVSVNEHPLKARTLVGMVFQDAESQIVGETVVEDVAFGPENLKLARAEVDRRVAAALAATGLAAQAEQRAHRLSGGEKRRLAIAAILAMEPRVVVFDEPFSYLDYSGVRQVLEQMLRLQQGGRTILVATHDLDKLLAHADRLMLMHRGRLVSDGRPQAVLAEAEDFGVRRPRTNGAGLDGLTWLS